MGANRISLRDIAAKAGVNVSTVSPALRNDPRIRPERIAELQKLAATLGYRHNPHINVLMRDVRRRRIAPAGVSLAFIHGLADPGLLHTASNYDQLHQGVCSRAREIGITLETLWVSDHPDAVRPAKISAVVTNRRIDGVIVGPMSHPLRRLDLPWAKLASLAVSHGLREPSLHRVVLHQIHAMRLALQHLIDRGYRRIGYVDNPIHDANTDHNWSTAYAGMSAAVGARRWPPPHWQAGKDRAAFNRWFRRHRPDALVVGMPRVVPWLTALGLRVPADIGVVSLLAGERNTSPALSGCDQQMHEVGRVAVDVLARHIYAGERGLPRTPLTALVEPAWFEGATLPCPADHLRKASSKPDKSPASCNVLH